MTHHLDVAPDPDVAATELILEAGIAALGNGAFVVAQGVGRFEFALLAATLKVRTLLTRRKRRKKRGIGWRRWSNALLYDVLGLYWDWRIRPLPGTGAFA